MNKCSICNETIWSLCVFNTEMSLSVGLCEQMFNLEKRQYDILCEQMFNMEMRRSESL